MSDWLDDDSEAAHLAEIEDEFYDDWLDDDEDTPGWPVDADGWPVDDDYIGSKHKRKQTSRRENIKRGIEADEKRYNENKAAKVGDTIICAGPKCGSKFKKRQYAQAFCCNHCKDQFWNRREAFFGFRKPID